MGGREDPVPWEVVGKKIIEMVDRHAKTDGDEIDDWEVFWSEYRDRNSETWRKYPSCVVRVMTTLGEQLFFYVYKCGDWHVELIGRLAPPHSDELLEEVEGRGR